MCHDPKAALAKMVGWARVVWERCLGLEQEALPDRGEAPWSYRATAAVHTQAKRTQERGWLTEVSNVRLPQSIPDLDKAFRSWRKS